MSGETWQKLGTVVGIVLALVIYKSGGKLFRAATAPSSQAASSGPRGDYRGGVMAFRFNGDGSVDWPAMGRVFRGSVTVKDNKATLVFPHGPNSTDYKSVPTTLRVLGYQDWSVLELHGTNVVLRRQ
jgi:hypothetical protein